MELHQTIRGMPKVIGVGILGWGNLAQRSLAPAIKSLPEARLVSVGTRFPESARNVPEDVELLRYEDLIIHPEIEAVHVANANHLHVPWVKKALEAGKHVLCEKPLAWARPEMVEELLKLAGEKGLLFAEAFMYRHHEQYAVVRKILDEGKIGKIRRLDATFSFRLDDFSNIRWQKDCWGGAASDVGCYGLDISRWLLGRPESSKGFSWIKDGTGVDGSTSWLLRHAGGVVSRTHVSMQEPMCQKVLIQGESGEIEIPHAFIPSIGKRVNILIRSGGGQEVVKVPPSNTYSQEWSCFLTSIEAGQLLSPLENGLENAIEQEKIMSEMEMI